MPKTLIQSVVSELQKERTRLEDELHRVTAALTAFGKVYLRGKKENYFGCRAEENSSSSESAMGKG